MYKYLDYKEYYGRIMQFGKNKKVPIHRWYPFVEGYSREFIESIVSEQKITPKNCLEPFSGSGTTALELQRMNIECHSFEVNPFMFTLSNAKLKASGYRSETIRKHLKKILNTFDAISDSQISSISDFSTLVEEDDKNKWNLNKSVFLATEKIMLSIEELHSKKYKDIYIVALANVLLEFGNLYRNGKCLSYKKDWQENNYNQREVMDYFSLIINKVILPDLEVQNKLECDNSKNLYLGDSRTLIDEKIDDDSIDLVITSPPYLNSRDYTDSYMLELKALGYLTSHKEIRALRAKTLRSHVQLKLDNDFQLNNTLLSETVGELIAASQKLGSWNDEIVLMVQAYFDDIKRIFDVMFKKVKKGKNIYFNVSNSAYYGVLINTLDICASIAEDIGFEVLEIREARYLNPSPQQREKVGKLLEGVIVLKK